MIQVTCIDELVQHYIGKVKNSSLKRLLCEYWSLNKWREDQLTPRQYARKQALFACINTRPKNRIRKYREVLVAQTSETQYPWRIRMLKNDIRWLDRYLNTGESIPGRGKLKNANWIYDLDERELYSRLEDFLIYKIRNSQSDYYHLESHEPWIRNEIWDEIHAQQADQNEQKNTYSSKSKRVIFGVLQTYRERKGWIISEEGLQKEYELFVANVKSPIMIPIDKEKRRVD